MANTVLGKVCPVPRGDYSATETYYALDIVGYNGGSYLAMKELTGVTPSNDQVNWMQLSGPGLPGVDGVTFTPSVSESGEISWTNDGDKENPDPVNIMGPAGAAAGFGTVTATADNTSSETPSVDVQSSGPNTAKNFTFAFTGLRGTPGETPDIEIGTVTTLEPGQDATADITGTTPNLSLSLGIPKGQPGTSVSRIERTSGTGAAGTTDTYTMYDSNDDAIGTFTVYNGANGAGAGDMMADGSVPMTGALDMGGQRVTNVGAPTAPTDAVRQSDLEAISDEIDHILDGTTPVTVPVATEIKAGIVKPGEGMSVTEDGTLNVDDQLPAGGQTGQVLTKTESGEAWQDAPDGLPAGGETGQVLTKTSTGAQWDDIPSDLPAGGTDGQILTKTDDGVAWENPPDTGVISFNGRKGEVSPGADDYSASMIKFTDGQTFQQKYDAGQLTGPAGANGSNGADGKDGGYYKPAVDGSGNLTWTASKSGMPAVSGANIKGATGPAGADGAAATISVGTVATGAPGSQAQVVNAGTSNAAVLNFTIPQGPQGPAGDDKFYIVNLTKSGDNYSVDRTFAEMQAQMQASKPVVFALAGSGTIIPATVLFGNIVGYWVYPSVWSGTEIGELTMLTVGVTSANEVQATTRKLVGAGTDLIGTDYTANRVRGMAFQATTPASIPNGCSVGVYE